MVGKKPSEGEQTKSGDESRQNLGDFVAMNPTLDGVDLRVYTYLSSRVNFREFVHVPQIELAVALGKQQTHISRSLRKLVEVGVLLSGPEGTRASKWMFNPDCGT